MMLLSFIIGAITGILSGLGVGGGSLLVLYLTTFMNTPQPIARGINLLYFIGCAPAALIGHIKRNLVDYKTVLWCSGSGVLTAVLVSLLVQRIHADLLRQLFGCVLIYVAIREWRRSQQYKE